MSSTKSNLSILLVDDNSRYLQKLKFTLMDSLQQENVSIRAWNPKPKGDYLDLVGEFESFIDENTILVATDYDLTRSGMRGFFGDTVVGWCRRRFIPVGDFSRANATALTEKPDLFELRIPANNVEGARYIANVYCGFSTIRNALSKNAISLGSKLSLSAMLAELLERPYLDSHFSLYMSRIVMNNSAIVEHVRPSTGHGNKGTPSKIQVVTYLLGHILINAILRYPGPILSERSLCAYLATSNSQAKKLKMLFSDAVYKGPFGEEGNYFWLEDIDAILDNLMSQTGTHETQAEDCETIGSFNRKIAENELKCKLENHQCMRCHGSEGGFYCPFTERTVCQRADCSVSASSWIPHGADLCRVEREFFDEWSPILGL